MTKKTLVLLVFAGVTLYFTAMALDSTLQQIEFNLTLTKEQITLLEKSQEPSAKKLEFAQSELDIMQIKLYESMDRLSRIDLYKRQNPVRLLLDWLFDTPKK
jgi:hypothetical protein